MTTEPPQEPDSESPSDFRGARSAGPVPAAGDLLFGRYEVARELGRGGMGVVLLARDRELGIDIAIKLVPDLLVRDEEGLDELKREVLRGMTLTHPGVVRTNSFERDTAMAAIVMEFVDGGHFGDLKRMQSGGCFDTEQLLPWLEQLGPVLDYAHFETTIAHRDLKPRNLMYNSAGRLKVADFGISSTIDDSLTRISMQRPSSGTPAYMSPQQVMGDRPSHLDDIYALGATIYELLTGKPPFYRGQILAQVLDRAPDPMHARRAEFGLTDKPPIPHSWEETIAACLAKQASVRPQSAGEVINRLRALPTIHLPPRSEPEPAGQPAAVAEEPLPKTPPRRKRRRKIANPWTLTALAALVLSSGFFLLHALGRQEVLPPIEDRPVLTGPRELPPAQVGVPHVHLLTATKLTPPLRWSLAAGSLPAGLHLDESGVLSGTPEAAATALLGLQVTDNEQRGIGAWRSLVVQAATAPPPLTAPQGSAGVPPASEPPRIASARLLPTGTADTPYHGWLAATGGTPPYTWTADAGSLPDGLRIDRDGLISGTPSGAAETTLLVELADAGGSGIGTPIDLQILLPPPPATREKPFENSLTMRFVPTGQDDLLFSIWLTRVEDFEAFVAATGYDATENVYSFTKDAHGEPDLVKDEKSWKDPGFSQPEDIGRPVCGVSWNDAKAFCKWLTQRKTENGKLPAGFQYRLPTDAEWHQALGIELDNQTADYPTYPWGDLFPPDPTTCNLAGSEIRMGTGWAWKPIEDFDDHNPRTSSVGEFPANNLGIHDLYGNLWQFCEDRTDDPLKPHIVRGGSWSTSSKEHLRLVNITRVSADYRCVAVGFRCVIARSPNNQTPGSP